MRAAGYNRQTGTNVQNGTAPHLRSETQTQHQREDRRVTRTRRILKDALIGLILEKGYAALTVQEILDRADVGRATFYAHYHDKEALLLSVFAELRDALREGFEGIRPQDVARFGKGVGLTLPLFTHADQHRHLYRALLSSRDGAVLLGYLRDVLTAPLAEHLRVAAASHGHASSPVPVMVAAFVSAVLGVLVWWLEADAPYTPVEMDRMVERLLAPGMSVVLHDPHTTRSKHHTP
jgi:AcrR family transcriptional regulator